MLGSRQDHRRDHVVIAQAQRRVHASEIESPQLSAIKGGLVEARPAALIRRRAEVGKLPKLLLSLSPSRSRLLHKVRSKQRLLATLH